MKLSLKPTFFVQIPARRLWRWAGLALLAGWIGTLATCSPRQRLLDEVLSMGVLKVAMVNSPTSYYIGPSGDPMGFEYDLVAGLAAHLGVELQVVLATNAPDAAHKAQTGVVHLAAAGIGITPMRARQLRFTRALQSVEPLLVYRKGEPKPKNMGELSGTLRVVAASAQAHQLQILRDQQYPQLTWEQTSEAEAEELLLAVANGEIDYTVANSDLVAINQRYYTDLRIAFAIAEPQPLAWALPLDRDESLWQQIETYLEALDPSELSRLHDRYFGHVDQVDNFGALTLAADVEKRLPRFRKAFEAAAQETGLDWRLLAAIGYQESHWNPAAVSPTGVRGIMQMTTATARQMGVQNREDPYQSIMGGSRYIRMLIDKLPEEITEPDRTWLALVAYNIGYGHLLDVRKLTQTQNGDPNRWLDIRDRLLLLTQSRWHSQTKYGYARGHEARTYVGNVRTYYDMLVWMTGVPAIPTQPAAAPDEDEKTPSAENDPLSIDSPIL